MDDTWRHNNKLKEFQEWIIIRDGADLTDSGIYDLLKETYSSKVADIFLDYVNSPEYYKSEYKIQYDRYPETAEISWDLNATEYAELFKVHKETDCIKFNSSVSFGNILTSRYLCNNLTEIIATKENAIFLGKNRKPISHVNHKEDIDYELEY